jgi:hypothetical protein
MHERGKRAAAIWLRGDGIHDVDALREGVNEIPQIEHGTAQRVIEIH